MLDTIVFSHQKLQENRVNSTSHIVPVYGPRKKSSIHPSLDVSPLVRLSPSVVPVGNDMIPWIWGTRGKQSQSITSITGKYGFIWLHMTSTGMTRLVMLMSSCLHRRHGSWWDCQHSPSAYRATVVGVGTAARTCLWCLCLQTPGGVAAPATGRGALLGISL